MPALMTTTYIEVGQHMKRQPNASSLLIAVAASCLAGSAIAADWSVDKATSTVTFVGVQQGTKFTGRFGTFDATISFDPASPEGGSVVGTVQTDSVNTRDHDRDAALIDGDWFDSRQYPEASFESESIVALDDGTYDAVGQLTLRGSTRPMTLHFSFTDAGDGTAQFAGEMSINRFSFGVGAGWNDTSWVGEDVDVAINLNLTQ